MKSCLVLLSLCPALGGGVSPQADQASIDRAISKGLAYLKRYLKDNPTPSHGGIKNSDELLLWTFIHGDVKESDPIFQRLLKSVYEAPLAHTYSVALQAMCLEELDRVWYQGRIAQCAQALTDSQCTNGQWSYGCTAKPVEGIASAALKPPPPQPRPTAGGVKVYDKPAPRLKPKVLRQIQIKKEKSGGASGDNSNTQYAVLGLRVCHDAGIRFPEDTLTKGYLWWMQSQHAAGAKDAVATGSEAPPRGWSYKGAGEGGPTLTMTAGGVSSAVIYDYIGGRDWKKDAVAQSGLNWLTKNFAVNANGYYMYGLERAAILYDVPMLGTHDWYREGAAFLVSAQAPEGSWGKGTEGWPNAVWDTCFAVLFLKKATRPLVISEDGRIKR